MTVYETFYVQKYELNAVRLVSSTPVAGTYYNGQNNDGVGSTFTVAASSLTIDGVVVKLNDEIALLAQANPATNGVWVVNFIGTEIVLVRRPDLQSASQFKPGMFFSVMAGTTFSGALYTLVEPQVSVVGFDSITIRSVDSSSSPTSATFDNTGLKVRDVSGNFAVTMHPASTLTANRSFNFATGDADRTLDISAADVTVSAFGATLTSTATKLTGLTDLGVKRGTTAAYAGGGTTNAFVATGLLATDIVVATILTSTTATAAIAKAAPTTDTLTVDFSADPGANTTVSWIAIATV